MIKLFTIAIQTLFGWTVFSCGAPAADFQARPPEGFHTIEYACVIEVNGDRYGTRGTFFRLEPGEPFLVPNKSTFPGEGTS